MSISDFAKLTNLPLFNMFFHLLQKFNLPVKMAGKCFLNRVPHDCRYALRVKNFIKIILSRTIAEINVFLLFMQKFKMAAKNGGKVIFGKVYQKTLQAKIFIEIAPSRTVSEINAFLRYFCNSKNGRSLCVCLWT